MHKHSTNDPDPTETEEWVDALEVIIQKGRNGARALYT